MGLLRFFLPDHLVGAATRPAAKPSCDRTLTIDLAVETMAIRRSHDQYPLRAYRPFCLRRPSPQGSGDAVVDCQWCCPAARRAARLRNRHSTLQRPRYAGIGPVEGRRRSLRARRYRRDQCRRADRSHRANQAPRHIHSATRHLKLHSPLIAASATFALNAPRSKRRGRGSTRRTGRTRRSAGVSRVASIPPNGQAAAPSRKRPASGGEIRNK
jgi:hypothetical protein